jgi:glutaredoxin
MQVKMYTKEFCSFCYAAKRLLTKRGISYQEILLTGALETEQEMRDVTGNSTVPQILIDGNAIGGYTELVVLDLGGELKQQ